MAYMYLSVAIPYKFAPAELLIAIPPCKKLNATALLPPALPATFQTPVKFPLVVALPVLIFVVYNVPIFAVVILALAIVAFADTVKNAVVVEFADRFPTADRFPAARLPVTLTAPNVVVPPELVADSDNQARAFDVPSAGQIYIV